MTGSPSIILLAGPNGAGKSTAAAYLLPEILGVSTFVNADMIAAELSPDAPERAAFEAGRRALAQLDALTAAAESFALETTLAGRAYVPWLRRCIGTGYQVHLRFLWLPAVEDAIQRVAHRVASGGHNIPEDVIRRRYAASVRNFVHLYRPLATTWALYDSSERFPRLIVRGEGARTTAVADPSAWVRIQREHVDG